MKVGLFALFCILIIGYATIKVSDRASVAGGGYDMTVTMHTALGIKKKTPVEIAGIQIGVVKKIRLNSQGQALVTLSISSDVRLPAGTTAYVRAKGFLGETFVELRPGPMENDAMAEGDAIPYGGVVGDINLLLSQFNEIAADIKTVTSSLKGMVGSDSSSPVYRTVHNMDKLAETLKDITLRNEASLNRVVDNMAVLTSNLRNVVERRSADIDQTIASLSNITRKVDEGSGTIGKLVNDDETINKVNDALGSLSDTLGGLRRMETQIGFHTEYLGGTNDFKQYVHLNLLPTPDKGFLFEFVSDPNSSPNRISRTTDITAGGATSTVTTNSATIDQNRFLFSAMLAKKFYDFTLRGGIIESTGGVGLDYTQGPVGMRFSAFDFDTKNNEKPHLKLLGQLNLTKALYLVGGADDMINPAQQVDWFVGAGFRLVDDDVKSLFGIGAKAIR